MNGAQTLVHSLVASGVEVCFTNPGTSEMHFVAALDDAPDMRAILGLFEGVVTGAADGYGRMAGKPAATLLHLGPGLANGLANLHNARRADTPIVNIVGDHATDHLRYDAPLTSDIRGFAAPVSSWIETSTSARRVASDGARAVAASLEWPGRIATLILPANTAWEEAEEIAQPLPRAAVPGADDDAIDSVARALANGKPTALLLRGNALQRAGLEAAGRIAARTGARLFCDTFTARIERGAGHVPVERLPYFSEQAAEMLASVEQLVLVGSKPPVSFFAYPDKPSWLSPPGCAFFTLAHPHQDGALALAELADAVNAPAEPHQRAALAIDASLATEFNQFTIGSVIARRLPEGAIVIDDAATSGLGPYAALATAAPHDHLSLTGGSIGIGMPLGIGAAVACPDRKTVVLEGDGSGMYTVQALWTQARENLDVVNIVFSNRSYAILNLEMHRVGAQPGPKAAAMLDLHDPDLDWGKLAQGMGVESSRAASVADFDDQLAAAMAARGPRLIEVAL